MGSTYILLSFELNHCAWGVLCINMGVQYIFIEIQEYIQLYNTIQYIIHNIQKKTNIYSGNKVSIDDYCHAPKISNDKEEAVQLMCLLKDIMIKQ